MNLPDERMNGAVPRTAASTAAETVDGGDVVVVSGFGRAGYPKAVPEALATSDRDLALTVVSGGSVGDEIDTALVEAGAIARRVPFQATAAARAAVNDGRIAFADRHIARLGDEVRRGEYGDPDVAVVEAVAVGEDWLIPTTSVGPTPAFVAAADRLVAEVNDAQPLELARLHDVYDRPLPPDRGDVPLSRVDERVGSPRIEFDPEKLVAVVRTDRPDSPYEFRDPTDRDEAVAANLAAFLVDELDSNPTLAEGVTLQFGVGSLGNALMGAFADVDFGDRDVAYFGEVIQDGLLDMLDRDALTAASATSLALSAAGQRRLFADVDHYAEDVVVRNAAVSNDPALVDRFGVVAVNTALEVDCYGHANSTHLRGTDVVNGIGGSGDFTRNAHLSVVALGSTAGGGEISRIVPLATHVDHPEHDVDVVVTERGLADLRGTSPSERADLLVERCAHPDYRADLRAYLDRAQSGSGHEPHDFGSAFDWQGRESL
jgi:succinyl-CoA:acetate CoA-transferase